MKWDISVFGEDMMFHESTLSGETLKHSKLLFANTSRIIHVMFQPDSCVIAHKCWRSTVVTGECLHS